MFSNADDVGEFWFIFSVGRADFDQVKDHLAPAKPLTLNLVSRESSKPGIASVVRSYIRNLSHAQGKMSSLSPDPANFNLSIDELGSILEGICIGQWFSDAHTAPNYDT